MAIIKYFDELLISKIISEINNILPFEYIYFEKEFIDNINVARKTYIVKFKNEEEKCYIHLTDIPFKLEKEVALYGVLFESIYGRFYAHPNQELNSIALESNFKSFAEVDEWKENFKSKKI